MEQEILDLPTASSLPTWRSAWRIMFVVRHAMAENTNHISNGKE